MMTYISLRCDGDFKPFSISKDISNNVLQKDDDKTNQNKLNQDKKKEDESNDVNKDD